MPSSLPSSPSPSSQPIAAGRASPSVLVVDDEPDVHAITSLSLRGLRHGSERVALIDAFSGKEAVEIMKRRPDIAVMLLDVVMESDQAGLEACKAIRSENPFVRILLRTGQPGQAPERQTIDTYDIDGYLPKAELTGNRLYVATRTAIRAWERLVEIDRHRRYLAAVHDCAVSLRSFETLPVMLNRILDTAAFLCPADLALLVLSTFEEGGNPRRLTLHLSSTQDEASAEVEAAAVISRLSRNPEAQAATSPRELAGGYWIPLTLHRELGNGFIFLAGAKPDELAVKALPLLSAHAENALYSSVAEKMLSDRQKPLFDALAI